MKLKRNHKTIITACMLLLYVFIATPVSYWHQHEADFEKHQTEQQSSLVKVNATDADANCKICSQHYSVADNDALTSYFSAVSFFNSYNNAHFLINITNPGYSQSNKGPPATV